MNKKILIVFLLIASVIMGYLTYDSIHSEIVYRERVAQIDQMVIGKLDTLRKMQMAYRDANGKYAQNFDELFSYMRNGKILKLKQVGENDGEVISLKVDSLFLNPMEEILGSKDAQVERYKLVPPDDTAIFIMDARTINQNNVDLPVFMIKDPYPFNTNIKPLQVGDLRNAITNGNWK
jgi:hypothetical protein